MATSTYFDTDRYNDLRHQDEPIYTYDDHKSFLDNISIYIDTSQGKIEKVREILFEGRIQESFRITRFWESGDKSAIFTIQQWRNRFMFGWEIENLLQDRSWQFVIRDIRAVFTYHLF